MIEEDRLVEPCVVITFSRVWEVAFEELVEVTYD
jgi:hypothetical protein